MSCVAKLLGLIVLALAALLAFATFGAFAGDSKQAGYLLGFVTLLLTALGIRLCRKPPDKRIRLAMFNDVKIGDSLRGTISLLGDGRQMSSGTTVRKGKSVDRIQVIWSNTNGSFAEITFENGRVAEKSQFGLG